MKVVEHDQLVEEIRRIYEKAHAAYQPRPGRPKIRELTGAPDHAVRKAMGVLKSQADAASASTEHDLSIASVMLSAVSDPDVTAAPAARGEPARQHLAPVAEALTATSPPLDTGVDHLADAGHFNQRVNSVTNGGERTGAAEPALEQPPAAAVPEPAANGRLVAWIGFVFGSVASIAANVLHTWLPAYQYSPGWTPGLAPQIGAAVWPIGLLLSVEVLSRVAWPPGWEWNLARYGGTGIVALGSAIISYGHQRDLLLAWHYGPLSAAVGPLVLDGLMVISGFALLAISRKLA